MIENILRRPITILMICLAICVLGVISYQRIPLQYLPEFNIPQFKITTVVYGATALEIEQQVTVPIERALSTLPGVREISSQSEKERSVVTVSLRPRIDLKDSLAIAKDRVDGVGLPDAAEKPLIQKTSGNSNNLFILAIKTKTSEQSLLQLREQIENSLLRKIEKIDGVALAQITGSPKEILSVEIKPEAISGRGLNLQSLSNVLQGRNRFISLGEVRDGEKIIPLKLGNIIEKKEDILSTIVKRENNSILTFQDISEIKKEETAPPVLVRLNQTPALLIEIQKEADANAVNVANEARQIINSELEIMSSYIDYRIILDQGAEIETAVDNVKSAISNGGIMASIVIYILLQVFWPSFVVSLTIPLSLLITFTLMYLTGVSFNLMSLAGLALGVGMLVDNATVVLESIENQLLKTPDPTEAAVYGTKKVIAAISSSTFSTMAVFAPLVFLDGALGMYFRDIAKTVCYSIFASLIISLLVVPLLAIHRPEQLKKKNTVVNKLPELNKYFGWRILLRNFEIIKWVYTDFKSKIQQLLYYIAKGCLKIVDSINHHFLDKLLFHVQKHFSSLEEYLKSNLKEILIKPKKVIFYSSGFTFLSIIILLSMGAELFPDESIDRIDYSLEFPAEDSSQKNQQHLQEIEKKISAISGISNTISYLGEEGKNRANLILTCDPKKLKTISAEASSYLSRVPYLTYTKKVKSLASEGAPIVLEIYHTDLKQLKEISDIATAEMNKISYLTDIQSNQKELSHELRVILNRNKVAQYGADVGAFVGNIVSYLKPITVGVFNIEQIPTEITLKAQRNMISSSLDLGNLSIDSEDNKKIFLSQISDIQELKNPTQINHHDRKRVALIQAYLKSGDLETAAKKIEQTIGKDLTKKNIEWRIAGQNQSRKDSTRNLSIAFITSICIIFILLASQFENLKQPIIILLSVPLCLVGVTCALLLAQMHISALVLVGFIILVGLSVNTSIVMVDFANQLVTEGRSLSDAIIEATCVRMRPILVTTASNILGLVPMLFTANQPGGSMQMPLAVTLIGGLVSSTFLTLIVVPPIFVYLSTRSSNVKSLEKRAS